MIGKPKARGPGFRPPDVFRLHVGASQHDARFAMERKPMPSHWDWPLNAPVFLTVAAWTFDWQLIDAQAFPNQPGTEQK